MGLKTYAASADAFSVTPVEPPTIEPIDAVLGALPPDCALGSDGDARLVVHQAGAFVVLPAGGDPTAAALRAGGLASMTRSCLADHVTWVPFIDAVIVTAGHAPVVGPATPVPLDLLAEVLVEGRNIIEEPTLATVRQLLDDGRLSAWMSGLPGPDAKIDLCQPVIDVAHTA